MKGFPKNLNTREDYEYVRANFTAEEWKPEWQALLDTMSDYFFVKTLEEGEEAPEGDGYKVQESEQDGVTTRSLYQLQENPACKLLRLGFTKAEVKEALAA